MTPLLEIIIFGLVGLILFAVAVNHTALVIRGETVVGFPANVKSWIWDYDMGAKVGPISFELELP